MHSGHTKTVKQLLDRQAKVNQMASGQRTALHIAAQKGNNKILDMLLHAGAQVDCEDIYGCTPLVTAANRVPIISYCCYEIYQSGPS